MTFEPRVKVSCTRIHLPMVASQATTVQTDLITMETLEREVWRCSIMRAMRKSSSTKKMTALAAKERETSDTKVQEKVA